MTIDNTVRAVIATVEGNTPSLASSRSRGRDVLGFEQMIEGKRVIYSSRPGNLIDVEVYLDAEHIVAIWDSPADAGASIYCETRNVETVGKFETVRTLAEFSNLPAFLQPLADARTSAEVAQSWIEEIGRFTASADLLQAA